MRFAEPALLLVLLQACKPSPKADFERLCHAHERARVLATDSAGEKAMKISSWLSENLTTQEAKAVLQTLPTLPVGEKREALTRAAAQAGVTPCALADETWPADAGT
ncbi:MAG: hypothetical protein IPJ65_32565 [Archangiaceae bacterium]|nr:hypothetical protein [Archangiaceae bacterium]